MEYMITDGTCASLWTRILTEVAQTPLDSSMAVPPIPTVHNSANDTLNLRHSRKITGTDTNNSLPKITIPTTRINKYRECTQFNGRQNAGTCTMSRRIEMHIEVVVYRNSMLARRLLISTI